MNGRLKATWNEHANPVLTRMTARALLVGDRIDTAGLERPDTLSQAPLAYRTGAAGMVALFRFGVAVMVGLSPLEEEDLLAQLRTRVTGPRARADDETATLQVAPDGDEPVEAGGPIHIKNLSPERFLVVADALAKSVALTRDEREVNRVFDVIEPFALQLAERGRPPFNRTRDAATDRPGAAGAAPRFGPRRGRGEARRAVGPARISNGSMRGWRTSTS